MSKANATSTPSVDDARDAVGAAQEAAAVDVVYPPPLLHLIFICALLLAMFLVALDMSIIATVVPTLTDKFHHVDDVGWYGSAFFMTLACFQAFWGRVYKFFALKSSFLACIGIFELGSLIVAVAQDSTTIVVGRAVQGLGGAGVTGGCYVICAFVTRPQHLAICLGLFGTVWSCAAVLGPVLGGVFTQEVSWRWCFWVNLPIGGLTMLVLFIGFKTPAHSRVAKCPSPRELFRAFDGLGITLALGGFVCILLVLQESGIVMPWSSSQSIGLLVGFGLLVVAFVVNEGWHDERAMLVPRLLRQRSILVCSIITFLANAGNFALVYNLPIYFQAVQNVSPLVSGLRTLPFIICNALFSFLGSTIIGRIGYYQPVLWVASIFATVGSAMIYTLDVSSGPSKWIGYQILTGIGYGLICQTPVIVAQASSADADMSVSVAIIMFFQFAGGAIGVSAATNIMDNVAIQTLRKSASGISVQQFLNAGTTGLPQIFSDPSQLQVVVNAYMTGLKDAWIFSIAMFGLAFVAACATGWKSIKPQKAQSVVSEEAGEPGQDTEK